ncbi:MAG TPA: flagellar motor protein MotB, partial [Flavobacterium sp.]|nr:flagellar motor protein MotB [Flavobacterium sp.]
MKKVIILLIVFLNSFLGFTQDKEKTKKEKEYDVWSVELNVGQNKAIRP